MADNSTLIDPQDAFGIIKYKDLRERQIIDNDQYSFLLLELDDILKTAWQNKKKTVEYDIFDKELYRGDIAKELKNKGYTFTYKKLLVDSNSYVDSVSHQHIIIDLTALPPNDPPPPIFIPDNPDED